MLNSSTWKNYDTCRVRRARTYRGSANSSTSGNVLSPAGSPELWPVTIRRASDSDSLRGHSRVINKNKQEREGVEELIYGAFHALALGIRRQRRGRRGRRNGGFVAFAEQRELSIASGRKGCDHFFDYYYHSLARHGEVSGGG